MSHTDFSVPSYPSDSSAPSGPSGPTGSSEWAGRFNNAASAWFTLAVDGEADFAVYSFSGRERVCEPYKFTIEAIHQSCGLDIAAYIGKPATLTIRDRFGLSRPVNGYISEMEQLHGTDVFTHYRLVLAPRLWFLGLNRDHRIFQNMNAIDIIEDVITARHGFPHEAFEFRCIDRGRMPVREYCVQYRESDLSLISRLCEEESVHFFFEHTQDEHKLVFSNLPGGDPVPGRDELRFYPGSGQSAEETVISRLSYRQKASATAAAYRDWNFERPSLKSLPVHYDRGVLAEKAITPPPRLDLEAYRYPHIYRTKEDGERYVAMQFERQTCMEKTISGASDAVHLLPGHTFRLHSHPNRALNWEDGPQWWLYEVTQEGEQPQVLEHQAPGRGFSYSSGFSAIPAATRFVPQNRHRKRRVRGQQTAIVTGPAGEEIYTDEYGRVKVQFFWDRRDRYDDRATCWLRVSQGWAGSGYGSVTIPRIGQEVVVSFMEGDPDRPIITGRLYNSAQMPPYPLPEHKTRTVFKSMSTPGEKGAPRGFNEVRVEDRAGNEEIYVHAEKDINTHTKNDWKDRILHDRHQTVENDTYTLTGGQTHETLKKERKTELFAQDSLTVHADSHFRIDGLWLGDIGGEIHINAGQRIVFDAGAEITLKVGGNYIKIDAEGVHADGTRLDLGGGSPALPGRAASPLLPLAALLPGQSERPVDKAPDMAAEDAEDQADLAALTPKYPFYPFSW